MKKLLCAVSFASLLMAGVGFAAKFDGDAHCETDSKHVIAWHWNGVQWPLNSHKIDDCVARFGPIHHADIHYEVDPQSLLESAKVIVDGRTKLPLYPMGVGGEYEFMSDFEHDDPNDGTPDRVIFHLPIYTTGTDKPAISVAYDMVVDGDKDDHNWKNVVCEFRSAGFR